jgi:hypothetical protein
LVTVLAEKKTHCDALQGVAIRLASEPSESNDATASDASLLLGGKPA